MYYTIVRIRTQMRPVLIRTNMAALTKAMNVSRTANNLTKLLANLTVSTHLPPKHAHIYKERIVSHHCAFFHTTRTRNDLMEFFDSKENWSKDEVKTGRSWKVDELRIKSNEDLHKLWFVLLKERNMLLTMEEVCKEEYEVFPNPERIDKVKISMENLESVVRERNQAYHLLETGEHGERPAKVVANALGMKFYYKMCQHVLPKFMNTKWFKTHYFGYGGYAVRKFLRLYKGKQNIAQLAKLGRDKKKVERIFRTFPNVDVEAVKQQFPDVDVDEIRQSDKARGHFAP